MEREQQLPILLDIEQVEYSYILDGEKKKIRALYDVNLHIRQGEYVVILGHNGSGKSTLARLCNALLIPEQGRILVGGRDTRDERQRRTIRNDVGMIFQNPDNQIIATVVEDDVAWSLTIQGMSREVIRERVEAALMLVGIKHLRHQFPHRLSGGERQRLAIAGILALRPRCIIADEATSMLDPFTRQEITQLFHRLHQQYGLTIMHVTHLLEEVVGAERVVVMEQGRIVLDTTPVALFSDLERLRQLQLTIPEPMMLAARLREKGLEIAPDALTNERLAEEITRSIKG